MAKGGTFERWFCRRLTLWWTRDPEADVLWWRTAQSGGRATVRAKAGRDTTRGHCGDIAATGPQGQPLTDLVAFELKRGYSASASLHDLLDSPDNAAEQTYARWIAQARASAAAGGVPYWAIVHQRNRRDPLILTPLEFARAVAPRCEAAPHARFVLGGVDAVAMRLEAFLTAAVPQKVAVLARQMQGRRVPRVLGVKRGKADG